MKVQAFSTDIKTGETRKTKVGKPKKAFTAVVKEGELMMSFSYGDCHVEDEKGNMIDVYIWINGDWKVGYKGKEYIIPMSENVNALIEWINENEN